MHQRNVAQIRATGSIIGHYLLRRHSIELPIEPKTDLSRTLIGENGAKAPEGIRQFASGNLRITCHTRYPRQALDDLLSDPDASLTNTGAEFLKHDGTTTLATVACGEHNLVVKRYNTKNAWHRLRRIARRSRAENCWVFTQVLQHLNVPTVPAVAWIQEAHSGLKGRSWFVSEFVDGISCLDHLKRDVPHAEIEKTLGEIVGILCKLRHKHISHGDLKATNILLSDQGPVLIDLDAMRQHKTESTYQQAARKDINRFLRNWQDNPVLLATARQLLSAQGFPTDPPS